MLRAIVVMPNQKTKEIGNILKIARAEAQRREHSHQKLNVRALVFVPECSVYVAVYERSGDNE